jgi:TonB family protein
MSWLLSYLFNALWQTPLLFAAAWIVAHMSRRLGPRIEHRIWVGALLLEIILPGCNFQIAALWEMLLSLFSSRGAMTNGSVRVLFGPATVTGNTLHLPPASELGIAIIWACTVLYFALRLAWGFVQTRRLVRTAITIDLPGDAAEQFIHYCLRFRIARPPRLAISPQISAPVAIGLHPGTVLLPPGLLDTVSPGDLDAVLAHELAHISRRDFTKNFLYNLLSLSVAWHPFLWSTRARLAESRELICDEAAAAVAAGPRHYAQSLLRLAAAFAGQPSVASLQAVGILDFSTATALERRVMTLTRNRLPLSTSRRILLAAACTILALATCTSALALRADISDLAPDAQQSAPKKIHVSAKVMAPTRISGDNPIYPPKAKENKIQGTVVIDVTVSKEGTVEDLHAVKTPDPSLAESAVKAVRTWRYRPYLLNGDPITVETTVNVTFCIEPCQLKGWWNQPPSGSSPDHN